MSRIHDLYKDLLSAAGLYVSVDGCISYLAGEEKYPLLIGDKRVVLPTQEHLKGGGEARVLFHPLLENLMRGESEVFTTYRTHLIGNLNIEFSDLFFNILQLAASPAEHKKLNPDQAEPLTALAKANQSVLDKYEEIIRKMPVDDVTSAFIKVYIKKNGKCRGTKHSRVAIVTFPFLETLLEKDSKMYGVTLRQNDRACFTELFKFIIKDADVAEQYCYGSDNKIAPNMDALMYAFAPIAGGVNSAMALYENIFPSNPIHSDWADTFATLDSLINDIRMIPVLPGNEGAVEGQAGAAVAAAPQMASFGGNNTQLSNPHQTTPAQLAPIAGASLSGLGSVNKNGAVLQTMEMRYTNPTGGTIQHYTPPPVVPFNQNQFIPQQNAGFGYQQPAPVAPPPVVQTANGIDFNSLVANDRSLQVTIGAAYQRGQVNPAALNPHHFNANPNPGFNTGFGVQQPIVGFNGFQQSNFGGNFGGGGFTGGGFQQPGYAT